MVERALGRRSAAPVQSTELDLTSSARGTHARSVPKKNGREQGSPAACVVGDGGFLLHDLGHGRLTGFAADVGAAWRTESRFAGLFQPVAMQLQRRRSANPGTAFLVMDGERTPGRRSAAPVQSTELDRTSFARGTHARERTTGRKKADGRGPWGRRPSWMGRGAEGLLHDLGHGRLTELAVRRPYGRRTEPRSAGLVQPVAARMAYGRSATFWNSLPCGGWWGRRSDGATPPRCRAPS